MVRSGTSGMQWLFQQKPIMNQCPNSFCKKALPRCSVCLLSMGSINPTVAITASGKNRKGINTNIDSDVSMPRLNFGDWWTWCQSCGHGGHAGHLASWFDSHVTCPVSDCGCNCLLRDYRALR